jgi:hypothetical protein
MPCHLIEQASLFFLFRYLIETKTEGFKIIREIHGKITILV